MRTMQGRTDRNPFLPALWTAVALGAVSLLLALARCGPWLRPVVQLCLPGCEAGAALCLQAAAGIDAAPERESAAIGCNAGREVCRVWCEAAEGALDDTPDDPAVRTAALEADAPEGPCRAFWDGCIGQGDPDVCAAGVDACRAELEAGPRSGP